MEVCLFAFFIFVPAAATTAAVASVVVLVTLKNAGWVNLNLFDGGSMGKYGILYPSATSDLQTWICHCPESFAISGTTHPTTQHHIPGDLNPHSKSYVSDIWGSHSSGYEQYWHLGCDSV